LDQNDNEFLSATFTLNNDRECKIVVEGEELGSWQFRKKALEPLFFDES
jgi:hypothetical protein